MSDVLLEKSIEEVEVQHELDTCGLFCPEPVMMLHNKIRDMSPGEVVRVLATDPSTKRDIPKFCNFLEHPLLLQNEQGNQFVYLIRKRI
ncbi:sulfurtransferase TusA [Endozoicomonas elysicola]|uniref:Sulfurtransferase n=1 Tax=Endozoicomonas elysicola TaxID=305900 RepID=A0A081KEF3_9GAMM|nr:sulfurtransferase TusA [Endozoicomonas elysicola]KEI72529.1 sulfurtransferase [Endozoicomonas elysicola]